MIRVIFGGGKGEAKNTVSAVGLVSGSGAVLLHCIGTMQKDEIMTKDYFQILQILFKSTATELKLWHSCVLQQDNDPKQTKTGFITDKVQLLEEHSQSSDLNPFKNVWIVLKNQLI